MLGRCGNQPAILAGLVRQTGHLQNKLTSKTSHIGVLWASLVTLSHLGGSFDGYFEYCGTSIKVCVFK